MGKMKEALTDIVTSFHHCNNKHWHALTTFNHLTREFPNFTFRLIGNEITCNGVSLTSLEKEWSI